MSGVARLVESVEKIREWNLCAIDLNTLMHFVFLFIIVRNVMGVSKSAISAVKQCLMLLSNWNPFSTL